MTHFRVKIQWRCGGGECALVLTTVSVTLPLVETMETARNHY